MGRIDWTVFARHRGLAAVTAIQSACAVYFIIDVFSEFPEWKSEPLHPAVEGFAVAALILGSLLGIRQLWQQFARNDHMEGRMRAASGAFLDLLEESFQRWGLTPSERDVALLSIKGLSVAEIAELRKTRSGTVKAQSAAVYRKAGVSSRSQLLSLFIEDLMSGLTLDRPPSDAADEVATDAAKSEKQAQTFP